MPFRERFVDYLGTKFPFPELNGRCGLAKHVQKGFGFSTFTSTKTIIGRPEYEKLEQLLGIIPFEGFREGLA